MSDVVQQVLASFEQLSAADRLVVIQEIRNRCLQDVEHGPLSDDDLTLIADELFRQSEREEAEGEAQERPHAAR